MNISNNEIGKHRDCHEYQKEADSQHDRSTDNLDYSISGLKSTCFTTKILILTPNAKNLSI